MATGSEYARPNKPVRYKYLSSINLGGNEIRYLGVNEQNCGVHFPTSVHDCTGRLLFLASDVLHGTSVAKKNHIRVHTRHAKNGLATKLRLTGFKIEGINNSGTMWFYSIQGLFHVSFELHNLATQKDLLTTLQSVWLQRYNDPLLKPDGSVRYNLRLKTSDQPQNLFSEVPDDHIRETALRQPVSTSCPSKIVFLTDEINALLEAAEHLEAKTDVSADEVEVTEPVIERKAAEKEPPIKKDEIGAGEFVEQLIGFVRSSISNIGEISHQVIYQILLTLDYLKHITSQMECEEQTDYSTEWGCVFFKMMEEYLLLIKCDTSDNSFENTFGLPREKYVLLYVVSDWVGREFHKLESQVAQKVDIFKKRNITSIDNLPPSETTIDMLFPICMKKLIVNWLGGPKDDANSLDWITSATFSDHNYSPPVKMRKKCEAGQPNYPLIQLILEFSSNCLISGIAHVVYSRLQCVDSGGDNG